MPTYDYACPKCGHKFEQFQQMSDPLLRRCPKCKKLGLKRLIGGGAGLIFKGTGFYITDYKKAAPPADAGDSKPAAPAADAKPAPAKAPAKDKG